MLLFEKKQIPVSTVGFTPGKSKGKCAIPHWGVGGVLISLSMTVEPVGG